MNMKMKIKAIAAAAALLSSLPLFAEMSEISVDLKLDCGDYVFGERVRGVVTIGNTSPHTLDVGFPESRDRFYVEVYSSADMAPLDKIGKTPFVSKFKLPMNEKIRLEVLIAYNYNLQPSRRYLARPVLVHAGVRYEGQFRAFDVVPGMECAKALQVFSNRDGLSREFRLVHWTRNSTQHLFLTACDTGVSNREWETRDLGPMMKITPPTISILPTGQVIVFHRYGPDHFIRCEFWSLPEELEFHTRELVNDPETAGHSRVQELYSESGGIKPVERPWWKFW